MGANLCGSEDVQMIRNLGLNSIFCIHTDSGKQFQRFRSETVGFAKQSKSVPKLVSVVSVIRQYRYQNINLTKLDLCFL